MIFPILVILTSIIFAIIAQRDLKLAIYLLLFALPTYLVRFDIGSIPLTLLEVLVVIVIWRWLVSKVAAGFSLRSAQTEVCGYLRTMPFTLPIALLLLAATIGVIVSPDKLSALGVWKAYFVEPILLFFVIRSTFKNKTDIKHALTALGCSALVVSVFGIIQRLTGLGIPAPWDIEGRIVSVFDFPNAVGLFLGPIVTMAVVLIATQKRRTFWTITAILSLIAIVLAQTEAAYVAIPVSLLLVSFLRPRLRRLTIPLAVVGFIAVMMIPTAHQKLTLHDYSGEVRRVQWSETIAMLKDRPLFGAGLSGYPIIFAPYHQADWIEVFQYPHNIILNIWSELGLLGLIAFILLSYRIVRLSNHQQLVSIAILAALIEMSIHGLVDVPYFKNDLAIMTWALVALLTLLPTVNDNTRQI